MKEGNLLHLCISNSDDMRRYERLDIIKDAFEAYPPFININGKFAPLRDISKRFASLDDFFFFYGVQIGNNPEKHQPIIRNK